MSTPARPGRTGRGRPRARSGRRTRGTWFRWRVRWLHGRRASLGVQRRTAGFAAADAVVVIVPSAQGVRKPARRATQAVPALPVLAVGNGHGGLLCVRRLKKKYGLPFAAPSFAKSRSHSSPARSESYIYFTYVPSSHPGPYGCVRVRAPTRACTCARMHLRARVHLRRVTPA
jgi:hypothetical protein